MERCYHFLFQENIHALKHAADAINHYFSLLESNPEIGKPLDELPELRELIIPFGVSGYIALYRYDAVSDLVVILAFRHQKEAGYDYT